MAGTVHNLHGHTCAQTPMSESPITSMMSADAAHGQEGKARERKEVEDVSLHELLTLIPAPPIPLALCDDTALSLQVMMQADYERKRAAAGLPVSSPGADEGSHKRARGGSGAEAPLPGPPPLPPSYGSHGHVHGGHGGHGHGSHGHGQGKGGYLEKEQLEEALQKVCHFL